MRKHILWAIIPVLLSAAPALAQLDSETPQYSGTAARIDYGMTGQGNPPAPRTDPAAQSLNDRSFDREVEQRREKISSEMERKREEYRRLPPPVVNE